VLDRTEVSGKRQNGRGEGKIDVGGARDGKEEGEEKKDLHMQKGHVSADFDDMPSRKRLPYLYKRVHASSERPNPSRNSPSQAEDCLHAFVLEIFLFSCGRKTTSSMFTIFSKEQNTGKSPYDVLHDRLEAFFSCTRSYR
jgi:hypothetical protein